MEGKEGAFHTQKTGGVNKMADKIECEIKLVKKQPREKLRNRSYSSYQIGVLENALGKMGRKKKSDVHEDEWVK